MAQQPPVGQSNLIPEDSRSHSGSPHTVGLLWMSDQLVAETSTWQHTNHKRDSRAPGGIRTRYPSKTAAADQRLRPRDHWDRNLNIITVFILNYSQPASTSTDH